MYIVYCYILHATLESVQNLNFRLGILSTALTTAALKYYLKNLHFAICVGSVNNFGIKKVEICFGCDTFGPERIWSPDICSPTIGPQLIGPSGQTVPKTLIPMDKWSPTNLVPLDKWSLEYSVCPGGKL